jgi:hypothetical protein
MSFTSTHKGFLLAVALIGITGCTQNHVVQNTYSQAVAQNNATQPCKTTTTVQTSVAVPVAVPMNLTVLPRYESGSSASGTYFYRRYQ